LGAVPARDLVLLRRQLRAPLGVALDDLVGLVRLFRFGHHRRPPFACSPYWAAVATRAVAAGICRKETASRFQPLIATIASVRSTSSFSLKCRFASSKTASGTWPSETSVTASHQASAALSRSLNKGDSRHTASA